MTGYPKPLARSAAAARPLDEAVLIAAARAGDEAAIAALVRSTAPAALAAARRITADAGLAEDAVQEAYARAFRALPRYRPEASFRAWVRTIAIRCAIDQVRRRRPETPLNESDLALVSAERRLEDVDRLRAALAELSPLDRELMLARELEGIDDGELARRFDLTVTAIRVRMHRARKRIRIRFEEKS